MHEGTTYPVDHHEVVAMDDALALFPADQLRMLRLFEVEQCLRVRHAVGTVSVLAG